MGAEVLYNRDGDLSYLSVLVEESQGGLMGDSVRVVHEEYSEGFRQKSRVVSDVGGGSGVNQCNLCRVIVHDFCTYNVTLSSGGDQTDPFGQLKGFC